MKKILIIAGLFLTSCSSETQFSKEDSLYIDSLTRADSLRNDAKEYGKRTSDSISNLYATNDIQFNISPKEFDRQSHAFLAKLRNKDDEKYYLGNYIFTSITPKFYQNRLYSIQLSGDGIHYDDYDTKTKNQYVDLGRALIEKYGQPKEDSGLPKWYLTKAGHWYRTDYWREADKVVEIYLNNHGSFNTIDLLIYRADISNKIDQLEQSQKDSLAIRAKGVL